jgi:non-ribosomal peptide synthetase component E (peptide arylation enzyme)
MRLRSIASDGECTRDNTSGSRERHRIAELSPTSATYTLRPITVTVTAVVPALMPLWRARAQKRSLTAKNARCADASKRYGNSASFISANMSCARA